MRGAAVLFSSLLLASAPFACSSDPEPSSGLPGDVPRVQPDASATDARPADADARAADARTD